MKSLQQPWNCLEKKVLIKHENDQGIGSPRGVSTVREAWDCRGEAVLWEQNLIHAQRVTKYVHSFLFQKTFAEGLLFAYHQAGHLESELRS